MQPNMMFHVHRAEAVEAIMAMALEIQFMEAFAIALQKMEDAFRY